MLAYLICPQEAKCQRENQEQDADSRQVQMLHNRIGRLGVIDRAIVLLWLEDLSYEEIGQIVGITAKHVGVKLFRIKELLKQES